MPSSKTLPRRSRVPVGWEGIAAPATQEQRPGREGRAKKWSPLVGRLHRSERRRLGSLRLLHGFGLGFGNTLLCNLWLRFCGKLLFDFNSNSFGVYLVSGCG